MIEFSTEAWVLIAPRLKRLIMKAHCFGLLPASATQRVFDILELKAV